MTNNTNKKRVSDYMASNPDLYFSDADVQMGMNNPDVFEQIGEYKKKYNDSSLTVSKEGYNNAANNLRKIYGNYSGDSNGSGGTYKSPEPTCDNNYTFNKDDYYDTLINSYTGKKPTYTNTYEDTIDGLLSDILNKKDFDYDIGK